MINRQRTRDPILLIFVPLVFFYLGRSGNTKTTKMYFSCYNPFKFSKHFESKFLTNKYARIIEKFQQRKYGIKSYLMSVITYQNRF